MKTHKLIRKLREALEVERAAAEEVVEFPVEATDAPYRAAKAETDKRIERIEKLLGTRGVAVPAIRARTGSGGTLPGGLAAGASPTSPPLFPSAIMIDGPYVAEAQAAHVVDSLARRAGRIGA